MTQLQETSAAAPRSKCFTVFCQFLPWLLVILLGFIIGMMAIPFLDQFAVEHEIANTERDSLFEYSNRTYREQRFARLKYQQMLENYLWDVYGLLSGRPGKQEEYCGYRVATVLDPVNHRCLRSEHEDECDYSSTSRSFREALRMMVDTAAILRNTRCNPTEYIDHKPLFEYKEECDRYRYFPYNSDERLHLVCSTWYLQPL